MSVELLEKDRHRQRRRCKSSQNGAIRWWTLVHPARGDRHRLQGVWIATCSYPHRQALQADLQQSDAYNPSIEKSKKMIRDMGNVELFELCETIPKVQ